MKTRRVSGRARNSHIVVLRRIRRGRVRKCRAGPDGDEGSGALASDRPSQSERLASAVLDFQEDFGLNHSGRPILPLDIVRNDVGKWEISRWPKHSFEP